MATLDEVRNTSRKKSGRFKKRNLKQVTPRLDNVPLAKRRSLSDFRVQENLIDVGMVECECLTSDEAWKTGRRIVELDTLSEGLVMFCLCQPFISGKHSKQ
jgi:hypothetical protein